MKVKTTEVKICHAFMTLVISGQHEHIFNSNKTDEVSMGSKMGHMESVSLNDDNNWTIPLKEKFGKCVWKSF